MRERIFNMRAIKLFVILFIFVSNSLLSAKETKNDISLSDSVILGLVEGATEYLPVSSTGHLIITNALLHLDQETPVLDKNGLNVLKSSGEVYTIKSLSDSYAIVIQIGAIASVALLYWRYILMMLLGIIGRNPQGFKLLKNLIIAFLPAVIVGLSLHLIIEKYLFGIVPVIIGLAFGSIVMIIVQKRYDKQKTIKRTTIETLSIKQALIIGILQCIAMIPGTSRSMMTILGGYIAGMDAKNSATFSFLLGLITLSAASIFKFAQDGQAMLTSLSTTPLLVGLFVAFISSAVAVKWLVGFLTKHGLIPFAIYRFILAGCLSILFWYNFI